MMFGCRGRRRGQWIVGRECCDGFVNENAVSYLDNAFDLNVEN